MLTRPKICCKAHRSRSMRPHYPQFFVYRLYNTVHQPLSLPHMTATPPQLPRNNPTTDAPTQATHPEHHDLLLVRPLHRPALLPRPRLGDSLQRCLGFHVPDCLLGVGGPRQRAGNVPGPARHCSRQPPPLLALPLSRPQLVRPRESADRRPVLRLDRLGVPGAVGGGVEGGVDAQ